MVDNAMAASFAPQLHILPPAQRRLWDELDELPRQFTLYGGTAVALHLGHRVSVDFDFFSAEPIDPMALMRDIPFLADAKVVQLDKNTLTAVADRDGPIKLSFFGLPHLGLIEPPLVADDIGMNIASLIDLAGTKASVVQQRSEAKDYLDIDAMMGRGVTLPHALAAAVCLFGSPFNPQITLKALSYFGDGDLPSLPHDIRSRLVKAVAKTDLNHLPEFKSTREAR
jgi:Nucleotidyl transferase AbiEii toxin, Type IV TA system